MPGAVVGHLDPARSHRHVHHPGARVARVLQQVDHHLLHLVGAGGAERARLGR